MSNALGQNVLDGEFFEDLHDRPMAVMCRLNEGSSSDLAEIDLECNSPPWTEKLFAKEFDNKQSIVYGARSGGALIGFLVCHFIVDEAHILNFGVRTPYRSMGFGKELLRHSLKDLALRGVRWATLEVRTGNSRARKLYEDFGFVEIGERKNYYTDNGEDAVVMGLNLRQFMTDFK